MLPKLSIAAKLYIIFTLLAVAAFAPAGIAVINARHQATMTADYETSLSGTRNVERVNGLIYAVVMESRGIYLSSDIPGAVRSVEAIGAIQCTIREVGEITTAIAAAVTEQGAATREIARSAETASQRTIETAKEVAGVDQATEDTRKDASDVKSVANRLGVAADTIRGQVDGFFEKLRSA